MARREIGKNKSDQDTKILIISEDLKSFPSYFEFLLREFRFGSGPKPELSRRNDRLLVKRKSNNERIFAHIRYVGSNPLTIVEKGNLEAENFDKIYCVFDSLKNGKDTSYKDAMKLKTQNNVIKINSAPNYEFWLILHFTDSSAGYLNDGKAIKKLEELIRKETGNKKFKYSKSEFPKELKNFVIEKLPDAIKRAKKIEQLNYQNNCAEPCTKIYQLIEDIQEMC